MINKIVKCNSLMINLSSCMIKSCCCSCHVINVLEAAEFFQHSIGYAESLASG